MLNLKCHEMTFVIHWPYTNKDYLISVTNGNNGKLLLNNFCQLKLRYMYHLNWSYWRLSVCALPFELSLPMLTLKLTDRTSCCSALNDVMCQLEHTELDLFVYIVQSDNVRLFINRLCWCFEQWNDTIITFKFQIIRRTLEDNSLWLMLISNIHLNFVLCWLTDYKCKTRRQENKGYSLSQLLALAQSMYSYVFSELYLDGITGNQIKAWREHRFFFLQNFHTTGTRWPVHTQALHVFYHHSLEVELWVSLRSTACWHKSDLTRIHLEA